jgi:SAM-dependent methyltransferase
MCGVCHSDSWRIFQKHGFWIRQCGCGHRFAELDTNADHVQHVYGDAYFTEGGDGYSDYLSEAQIITNQGRYYGQLMARYMQPGELLDVGAAAGFILQGFLDCGWRGVGVEPNQRMAEHARQRGLDVQTGTLETFSTDRRFDLINMTQVIAHFYDLHRALEAARRVTRQRGYWLIETWNKDSWMARLQGRAWHEYSPPSALHYFSLKTLTRLVSSFGLELVAHGRPPKKLRLSHARSLISYKLGNGPTRVLFDRVTRALPDWTLPYPSFDLMWVLFRAR